jgi:hypothetical protein
VAPPLAGGTHGVRRGRQRAEREAGMVVPAGGTVQASVAEVSLAARLRRAWSWKRMALRNRREQHLAGRGKRGNEC